MKELILLTIRYCATVIYWNLAWKTPLSKIERLRRSASAEWTRRQNEIADYAANFVSGSGWKGMYCSVGGVTHKIVVLPIDSNDIGSGPNTKAVGTGPAAGPGTHQPLVGGDHGR